MSDFFWAETQANFFLLNCHPELDYVVDERGTEHAFVLGSSEEMGEVVADFVRMDYGGGREKVS